MLEAATRVGSVKSLLGTEVFDQIFQEVWTEGMDPGQLVLPVAGIIAAAAVTFYVVSFQEMSAKSFTDYEAKIDNDDDPQTQLKSSMSSRKRREAKQAAKPKSK